MALRAQHKGVRGVPAMIRPQSGSSDAVGGRRVSDELIPKPLGELLGVLDRRHGGEGFGGEGCLNQGCHLLDGCPFLQEVDNAHVVDVRVASRVHNKLLEAISHRHGVIGAQLDDSQDERIVHGAEIGEKLRVARDHLLDQSGLWSCHVERALEGVLLALVVALPVRSVAERDHVAPVPARVEVEAALVHLGDVVPVLLHGLVVAVALEVVLFVPDDVLVDREAVAHAQEVAGATGEVQVHGTDERVPVPRLGHDLVRELEQGRVVAVAQLLHDEAPVL
mmetsp:Transcript_16959/g.45667  ORF Transcript_16959/g.45667 Transcript_16959/m.45667 type:complete len:279 (-) Transcript_16959:265-1101(-)